MSIRIEYLPVLPHVVVGLTAFDDHQSADIPPIPAPEAAGAVGAPGEVVPQQLQEGPTTEMCCWHLPAAVAVAVAVAIAIERPATD